MRNQVKHLTQGFPMVLFVLAVATPAQAYIGPGAGLGAIGLMLALVVGVVLLVVGFLWYPLKRAFKALRGTDEHTSTDMNN